MLKITRYIHILPQILFSRGADRKHHCNVLQGHSQIPLSTSVQVSRQQKLQAITVGRRRNQEKNQQNKTNKISKLTLSLQMNFNK